MSDVLDLGEVEIPHWRGQLSSQQAVPFREIEARRGLRSAYLLHDINYVRTQIRRRRYGEAYGPSTHYKVTVTWPNKDTAVWMFDGAVGWPEEVGNSHDWHAEWMQNYGGVA